MTSGHANLAALKCCTGYLVATHMQTTRETVRTTLTMSFSYSGVNRSLF